MFAHNEVSIIPQLTDRTYKEEHIETMEDIIGHVTIYPNKGLKYKKIRP